MQEIAYPARTTESQEEAIRYLVQRIKRCDFHGEGYEFKRLGVSRLEQSEDDLELVGPCKHVFLLTEVGLVGDEETMASVFARTKRHFMVGPRGGIRVYSKKAGKFVRPPQHKLMGYYWGS